MRTATLTFSQALRNFIRLESSGGIILLACTAIALAWANSPFADSYFGLWRTPLKLGWGATALEKPLLLWINDGLMAIFFFLVGMELKREAIAGELSSPRQAGMSIAGALGGMVVPAALYVMLNRGGAGASGWAIPMATDIAFALGVLALLGDRVPAALKVFLTALAIVDDLGAVLVIAFFYTASISWASLGLAGAVLALLFLLNRLGVRIKAVYLLAGVVLWVATLKSGVHATIAGVALAATIPLGRDDKGGMLESLEHAVHPWVTYFIVPVFALANAGVAIGENLGAALAYATGQGIILGLFIGKPVGIFAACWLASRLGLATLPSGTSWAQLGAAGLLAGIGFTMSLFIAGLAFGEGDLLNVSKLSILIASSAAGVIGFLLLRSLGRATRGPGTQTAE